MAQVLPFDDAEFEAEYLVEGLPGVGLVGQITVDHLANELGAESYARVDCDGLPQVAVFNQDEHPVEAPVRILTEPSSEIALLQSHVPVSPGSTDGFADCLVEWMEEVDVTPVLLSGLPVRYDTTPSLYGISTGDGDELLGDVKPPAKGGVVSGPTGAVLKEASDRDLNGAGLVVESDPQFPDPTAARVVIENGIKEITGVDVDTSKLVEQAEEIMETKKDLAKQMGEGQEDSTTATPRGMYN